MISPLSQKEVDGIGRSVSRVFKNNDIKSLTKNAYKFIMLSSGFIAHYNIHGFRDVYEEVDDLATALIENYPNNLWLNFRPGDENYDYYRQKATIYKTLVVIAKAYKGNRFGTPTSEPAPCY